jgi:hypothetical protein
MVMRRTRRASPLGGITGHPPAIYDAYRNGVTLATSPATAETEAAEQDDEHEHDEEDGEHEPPTGLSGW